MISLGNNSSRIIGTETSFDPAIGQTVVFLYEGDELALLALAAQFQEKRNRANVYPHEGPVYRMRVEIPRAGVGDELPVDTWEWVTDLAEVSIWSSPLVLQKFKNFAQSVGGTQDDALAVAKKQFKTDLKENTTPTAMAAKGYSGFVLELYTLLLRGQEAVELERKVLRRVRNFSLRYAGRQDVSAVPIVYTTGSLISTFGIPGFIAAQMPVNPGAAPDYTTWAWKRRRFDTQINASINRVVEQTDFVFAAWANLTHEVL